MVSDKDKREFIESVLNTFLVLGKQSGQDKYNITDLKLKENSFGLEIRNARDKANMDRANSLRFPLIEKVMEIEDMPKTFIMPPTENWNSLTLSVDGSLFSVFNGLKHFQKQKLFVLFEDVREAINTGNLKIPVRFCEFDFGLVKELKYLNDIYNIKAGLVDKKDFFDLICKRFLIAKQNGGIFELFGLSLDENFNPSLDLGVNENLEFLGNMVSTKVSNKVSDDFFVLPPRKEWKTNTLVRMSNGVFSYEKSLIKGISAVFALGFPVILYEDLMNAIRTNSFNVKITLLDLDDKSLPQGNFKKLIDFYYSRFEVNIESRSSVQRLRLDGFFK